MSEAINAGVNVYIDQDDPGTVKFRYPRSFKNPSILQEVRLEIGALAAWTPTQYAEIQPYTAECYPQVFTQFLIFTSQVHIIPYKLFKYGCMAWCGDTKSTLKSKSDSYSR